MSFPRRGSSEQDLPSVVDASPGTLAFRATIVRRLYLGLDGADPVHLDAIGARPGVTRERARQIEAHALDRLRPADSGRVRRRLRS